MLHALGHRLGGDAEEIRARLGDLVGGVFEVFAVMGLVAGARRRRRSCAGRQAQPSSEPVAAGAAPSATRPVMNFLRSMSALLDESVARPARKFESECGFFTIAMGLGLAAWPTKNPATTGFRRPAG